LTVAYLGTNFRGFALQAGVPTVAGSLAGALERALRQPVQLTCAGRTDAGVHAWGQVVSLDAPQDADLERLLRSLNKMVGPAIAVRELQWAPAGFDARRSALSRTYRYSVVCSPVLDPREAPTVWHVGQPLDLRGMQQACDPLLGEHDFSSFCRAPRARLGLRPEATSRGGEAGPVPDGPCLVRGASLVRTVLRAEWAHLEDDHLCFEIEARSFCHQMVRSIVGMMVEVGKGRRKAGELTSVLAARSRSAAGPIAPPHGLCLWDVKYPAELLCGIR
jgi:tRNA pseudouridine38-40 synthase